MSRDPRKEDMEHSEKVLAKYAEESRQYKEKIRCFIKKIGKSYWEEGLESHSNTLTEWHKKHGKPSGSIYHNEFDKIDMIFSTHKTIDYINRVSDILLIEHS